MFAPKPSASKKVPLQRIYKSLESIIQKHENFPSTSKYMYYNVTSSGSSFCKKSFRKKWKKKPPVIPELVRLSNVHAQQKAYRLFQSLHDSPVNWAEDAPFFSSEMVKSSTDP